MKNLPLAQNKPLLVLCVALGVFLSCNKDFDLVKESSLAFRHPLKTLPFTIAEAKKWYEHRTERSYDTLSIPASIYPLWYMAVESKYKDSADIVIVPIAPKDTLIDVGPNRGIRLIVFKHQDGTFGGCFLYFAGQNNSGTPNLFDTANFTGNIFTYSLLGTPLSLVEINAGAIVGGTNDPDSIFAKTAPPLPGNTPSSINLSNWNSGFWDISAYFSQALDDGNHNGGTKIITVWGIGPIRITPTEPPGNPSTGGGGGGGNTSLSQTFQNALFGNESIFNHVTEYPCRNDWHPQSNEVPQASDPVMPALLTAHPQGIGNFVQQWIQLVATGNYADPADAIGDIDWDEVGSSNTNDMMDGSPLNTAILQNVVTMLNQAKAQGCGYTVEEAWNALKSGATIQDLMELAEELDLTVAEINWLWDNIGGIEQASTPPTNPPIDVAHPICPEIFNFKTDTDESTNLDYAAMILTNSYYQFSIPGSSPVMLQILKMRLEVRANDNTACLNSCNDFAANAINAAMAQVQQDMNALPPGTPPPANLKSLLLVRIDREFWNQVRNCNSDYTSHINVSWVSNYDDVPYVNCDERIVDCQ